LLGVSQTWFGRRRERGCSSCHTRSRPWRGRRRSCRGPKSRALSGMESRVDLHTVRRAVGEVCGESLTASTLSARLQEHVGTIACAPLGPRDAERTGWPGMGRMPARRGTGWLCEIGSQARTFLLRDICGIPATAQAVPVNITVTEPTGPGHPCLYPAGTPAPPVNYSAGHTRANNAILTRGTGGEVSILTSQAVGCVHFLLDINHYFQ